MQVRAREGDFIETSEGLIFDVKGLIHPPERVIAYLRYLPDGRGNRKRAGVKYRKVYDLTARAKLLGKKWPHYIFEDPVFNREVQAVPFDKVKRHYLPVEKFKELRDDTQQNSKERLAADMAKMLIEEAGISTSNIGVSGSILVDLHTNESDIDLILYGTDTARRCRARLAALLEDRSRGLRSYDAWDLRRLYKQRGLSSAVSFERFTRGERSKVLQGKFRNTDYFIRCIKEWNELQEVYGDREYCQVGRARVRGRVCDDSEAIFTPSTYQIMDVEVVGGTVGRAPVQIVSFRGRFCEQAHAGERIIARGTLEKVLSKHGETHRLVIGENSRDFLTVVETSE